MGGSDGSSQFGFISAVMNSAGADMAVPNVGIVSPLQFAPLLGAYQLHRAFQLRSGISPKDGLNFLLSCVDHCWVLGHEFHKRLGDLRGQ